MDNDVVLPELDSCKDWLELIRERDDFRCEPASLKASSAWQLHDGAIVHKSGRFFSVIGLQWEADGVRHSQAFLDQQEVGTLGFVVREHHGERQILCHAKVEPGNVGAVQIAPTCQATRSNLDRVHGGQTPPYADVFTNGMGESISESLQSEQGSRFFRKRNLNVVLVCEDVGIEDAQHRWLPLSLFCHMLTEDFLVNTDARSVICSSDWRQLFGRPLFSGSGDFSRALRRSFEMPANEEALMRVASRMQALRDQMPAPSSCSLERLPSWSLDPDRYETLIGPEHAILHIRTHSETREVSDWDQPVFCSKAQARQTLLCSRIRGQLRFGFRYLREPGLLNAVEFAPTLAGELPAELAAAHNHLTVRQSDEGGRFFHDVTEYSIREIDRPLVDRGVAWLTLAEVQRLLPHGYFNNEARSALSLLLSLA